MALPDNIKLALELIGVDHASVTIDEAGEALRKYSEDAETAGNKSEIAANKSTMSWTEFRSAYSTVLDVVRAGQQIWAETVGVTVDLANNVRQMRDVTGQSAEESSRLLQVLDDYKISAQDAGTATKKLASEGLQLNVETLATLSERYLALNSDLERTQFLYDNFGKSGAKFAEIMSQGGDAIREANAAIDKNLILTDEALRQAREYERNVDNLNDSLMALKVTIGNNLIPVANNLFDAHELEIEAMRRLNIEYGDFITESDRLAIAQEKEKIKIEEVSSARMNGLASLYQTTEATIDASEATEELNKSNQEFIDLVGNMQRQTESFAEKYKKVNEDMKLTDEEKRQRIAEIAAEEEAANRRVILSMLEKQLSLDGLDARETEYLLSKGQEWGIYSDQAVAAAREAMAEVQALTDKINGLPTAKTFTFNINTVGSIPTGIAAMTDQIASKSKQGRANGGPVEAGKMYEVNERGMPELLNFGGKQMLMMPDTGSGYVTPMGGGTGGVATSGGVMINIMLDSATPDPERVAYNLKPAVERVVRDLKQQGKI